ncbi:MAG: sigma-54-dependent Fis family transcriptional regulator [Gammaproteobacteria bacterium]|nr:sigma-54-dependent Fis family transcriptional regulator [Gammaproteobacteria bacterium]MCP5199830.1 sigma-54-dependent Fis family transcriptional regulator [Gammaproteobacteria bacterium]
MARYNVLVVDDEVKMQRVLEIMLGELGHDVLRASDGAEALDVLGREAVDLVITDLRMPRLDGLGLIRELDARHALPPTIVVTAHGTVESAVEAMKLGALDYILRPFEIETVELAVTRALDIGRVQRENRFLRDELADGWEEFVGQSAPMQTLYQVIASVAPSTLPLLVVGETGTGKELVAHAVHKASGRTGLFVAINCAAIPESILESELFGHVRGAFTGASGERIGKFEASDRGTLFLDEITEMPAVLQARLLRVLQECYIERVGSNRRIDLDLRIIAATNRDPREAIAAGQLREDLYYRLEGVRIDVPPLRQRGEDIGLLARHFLARHAQRLARPVPALTSAALTALARHAWPGNVRELDNLMGRVVLLAAVTPAEDLVLRELGLVTAPAATPPPPGGAAPTAAAIAGDDESLSLQAHTDALERRMIETALARAEDNKARAARLLDISERTLWYKLKKLGLR